LSNTAIALRVLLLGGAFVAFCWVLVSLVRGSMRGGNKGTHSGDPLDSP